MFNGDSVEPIWPYTVRTLMGEGATSQITGSIHKAHRRVVMRAFTPGALRGYAGCMQKGCRQELRQWMDDGQPVNVFMQSKVNTAL